MVLIRKDNAVKEWKFYQELYNRLVTEHTDAESLHKRQHNDDVVFGAIDYITHRGDVGIYPGKSYMVAIIYATMINQVYGDDFYETLNDPDLLYGQDRCFVPYGEDPTNYDAIIERLKQIPNWIENGWAPKTVEYFHLECTQAGVDAVNEDETNFNH